MYGGLIQGNRGAFSRIASDALHIDHFYRVADPPGPLVALEHFDKSFDGIAFCLRFHLSAGILTGLDSAEKATDFERVFDSVVHHFVRNDALLGAVYALGVDVLLKDFHEIEFA
jgi:hypothetical protein